jgi:hypothetical protein
MACASERFDETSAELDARPSAPPDGGVNASAFGPCDHPIAFDEVVSSTLSGCGGQACHLHAPVAASLHLTPDQAYGGLVNARSTIDPNVLLVVPGDVAKSFAWRKITGDLGPDDGNPMPRRLFRWVPLDGDSLRTFRCWIEQGAPR